MLSQVSPANSDRHHHFPVPTNHYGTNGDHDLGAVPSVGLDDMGLALDRPSVGGKSVTKRQIKRRPGKACDHCRECNCKCVRTNGQGTCRSCIKLNIRKFFTGLRTFILLF